MPDSPAQLALFVHKKGSKAKGSDLNLYLTVWLADKKFGKEGDRGGSGSEWRRQAEGRTANRNSESSDSVWYHCVALSAISVSSGGRSPQTLFC